MTSLTQKFSTLALFLVVFGASTALAQTNDDQVPFTATGTGVVTRKAVWAYTGVVKD